MWAQMGSSSSEYTSSIYGKTVQDINKRSKER